MITLAIARDVEEFDNASHRKAHLRMFEFQASCVPVIVGYGQGPRLVCHGKNFYRIQKISEKAFYDLMDGAEVGSPDALELCFSQETP